MDQCHMIRTCNNHDQGCLCSDEGTNQTGPESENKSVQTATPTKSDRSTQTGKTMFGQEIHELDENSENSVISNFERDILANDDIETTDKAIQTEESSNPLEMTDFEESFIIAVNERDLVIEENIDLQQERDILANNYDNLVEDYQRLEEDHAVLVEVNRQRQEQVQNEVTGVWGDL